MVSMQQDGGGALGGCRLGRWVHPCVTVLVAAGWQLWVVQEEARRTPQAQAKRLQRGPKQMSINHKQVASLARKVLYGSLCRDGKLG